ncbi:TIGR03943 family protein [Paenibacillus faecis]|uniref:TIGR03943 family protein n=1 Tax=Paenibacillus faecis TaxID=862114 RepID=A0A5D0CIR8_9BACL|nr:TIGR03943 family protein [Paenibacillus faecis]TYA09926.1 TIGR03943 family protein [Paenibacillus faecis]
MKNKRLLFHNVTKTVLLLALSGYIAYLVETDALQLYIGTRIMPLVKGSALVLYALAVIQGFIAYRSYKGQMAECDCCEVPQTSSRFGSGLLYALFILPLLLGFTLPDTVLSGSLANKKGMQLGTVPLRQVNPATSPGNTTPGDSIVTGALIQAEEPDLDQLFQADNDFDRDLAELAKKLYVLPAIEVKPEIYMEILSSIITFADPFMGREIEITGFVYREPDLAANQFVIGRIAVQCCTADASPYGVLAESEKAAEFKNDTWVKVKGTLGHTVYNGNSIIKIDVQQIEVMEAPENPYIYPNFEFLNVSLP